VSSPYLQQKEPCHLQRSGEKNTTRHTV